MSDLVAPREDSELVAACPGGLDQRDADVIDGEGVALERPGGLLGCDQLASRFGARGGLGRSEAGGGEVEQLETAGLPNGRSQAGLLQPSDLAAGPLA